MTVNRDNRKYRDMSEKYLEPAKSIVAKIGVQKCAEVTGKHVSRVYRWMASKEKGGTGGLIPLEDATLLIAFAEKEGIALMHSEFFPVTEALQ
ncbi:hypothetical protein NMA58_08160 [Rhizobium sp. YTUHZ045]|uniref:hypothetical protein n=1 Tax=Rhizobium sp. YTUHZ045 TaxID=2962888 RepID=UPI003DA7F055